MGRFPQELIDQILDRVDIVEVISNYIHLKRAGRNFKVNCPFHNEKTPSFVVSPEKQIYHCFGCGAGGNAIGFVMKYENIDFPEAITILARTAGVELPEQKKDRGQADSIAVRLYEVNKIAAAFYQNFLKTEEGKKAQIYLKARGINLETLKKFKIGYAPDAWDSFRNYCIKNKISLELAGRAGLIITGGKGEYDRFRKRIIFPIFNERGSIIAFGGRVMDDMLPKYINSPETVIYAKSNVLYGLNFSRKGIREKGCAVIVEGYMDVIIPFQFGITNIVATSGTALTQRQVNTLKKYTSTAIMVFDADQAGEAASLRGLDILIENGMKVRVVTLPKGEDPDSFLKKNGREKFELIVKKAKNLFDYKLAFLTKKFGIQNVGDIAAEMLPTLMKIDNAVVQSDYIKKLAGYLGIHESSLRHEMGKIKPDYSYQFSPKIKKHSKEDSYRSSEMHLLGLAVSDRKIFEKIRDELGWDKFQDGSLKKVIHIINTFFENGEVNVNPGKLLARLGDDEDAKMAVIKALAKADITQEPLKAVDDCILHILKENRKIVLKELTYKLKRAQEANDEMKIKTLLVKINDLHKEKVT